MTRSRTHPSTTARRAFLAAAVILGIISARYWSDYAFIALMCLLTGFAIVLVIICLATWCYSKRLEAANKQDEELAE